MQWHMNAFWELHVSRFETMDKENRVHDEVARLELPQKIVLRNPFSGYVGRVWCVLRGVVNTLKSNTVGMRSRLGPLKNSIRWKFTWIWGRGKRPESTLKEKRGHRTTTKPERREEESSAGRIDRYVVVHEGLAWAWRWRCVKASFREGGNASTWSADDEGYRLHERKIVKGHNRKPKVFLSWSILFFSLLVSATKERIASR